MRNFVTFKMKVFIVCFSSLALASFLISLNKDYSANVFVASANEIKDEVVDERAIGFVLPVKVKGKDPIIADFVSTYLLSYFKKDYRGRRPYEGFNPFRNCDIVNKKEDYYGDFYLKFMVDYAKSEFDKKRHSRDDDYYDDDDDDDDDYRDYDDDYDDYDDDYKGKHSHKKKYKRYDDDDYDYYTRSSNNEEYENVKDIDEVKKYFDHLVRYFKRSNFFSRDYGKGNFQKYFEKSSDSNITKNFKNYLEDRIEILERYVIPSINGGGGKSKFNIIKKYKENEDYKHKRTRGAFNILISKLFNELSSSKPRKSYLSDLVYSKVPSEYKSNKLQEKIKGVTKYSKFSDFCDFLHNYYERYLNEFRDILGKLKEYRKSIRKEDRKSYKDLISKIRAYAKSLKYSPKDYYGSGEDIFDPIIRTEIKQNRKIVTVKSRKTPDKN